MALTASKSDAGKVTIHGNHLADRKKSGKEIVLDKEKRLEYEFSSRFLQSFDDRIVFCKSSLSKHFENL